MRRICWSSSPEKVGGGGTVKGSPAKRGIVLEFAEVPVGRKGFFMEKQMSNLPAVRRASCALFGAAALLASQGVLAQSGKAGADDWKFRASIYGWLPSLEAKSNFPVPPAVVAAGLTTGGNAEVNGGDILKSIESVFMGTFEARKGRWGGFTDLITLNLGQYQDRHQAFHHRRPGPAHRPRRCHPHRRLQPRGHGLDAGWPIRRRRRPGAQPQCLRRRALPLARPEAQLGLLGQHRPDRPAPGSPAP